MERGRTPPPDTEPLTKRQREVLALIARGYTNPQIAAELGLSLDGAKWHVREIMARLDARSRDEAVEIWQQERGPASRLRRAIVQVTGSGLVRWAAAGIAGVIALVVVLALLSARGAGETAPAATVPPFEPALVVVAATQVAFASEVTGGLIDVYANGERCGRLDFADAASFNAQGDATFVLGSPPGQPLPCSTAGASLSLRNHAGVLLFEAFEIMPGGTVALTTFGPITPHTYTPLIYVPEPLVEAAVATTGGFVDIYANDSYCGRLALDAPRGADAGPPRIAFQYPESPAECSSPGARFHFTDAAGDRLAVTFVAVLGESFELIDFALAP